MLIKNFKIIALASVLGLTGCQNVDTASLMGLGMQGAQLALVSDDEIRTLSADSCTKLDSQAKISPANSSYGKRLEGIAKKLGNQIDNVPLNYKVYSDPNPNAFAMANGCIRVYTGLMDMMTDDEIVGVLGHEIGHVSLGHSKKAMQVAYGTAIAMNSLGALNPTVAQLTQSQLGELAQTFVNSQFSQTQEMAADNFSYDYLKNKNLNTTALVTAFEKLEKLDNGTPSLLSTHPASEKRAENIRNRIKKDN